MFMLQPCCTLSNFARNAATSLHTLQPPRTHSKMVLSCYYFWRTSLHTIQTRNTRSNLAAHSPISQHTLKSNCWKVQKRSDPPLWIQFHVRPYLPDPGPYMHQTKNSYFDNINPCPWKLTDRLSNVSLRTFYKTWFIITLYFQRLGRNTQSSDMRKELCTHKKLIVQFFTHCVFLLGCHTPSKGPSRNDVILKTHFVHPYCTHVIFCHLFATHSPTPPHPSCSSKYNK